PIILLGLVLFLIGSVIAGLAHSIDGIIFGRAIQGAGAIGSTLTAMVADLTAEENRLKAMSVIGMTIGLSFVLAMIVGPMINAAAGLPAIFYLTAVLALLGILMILFVVPNSQSHKHHYDSETVLRQFVGVLKNRELLRLDVGIFCLHAVLTALFLIMPIVLQTLTKLPLDREWMIYLPVLILSFVAMVPFIIIAEAKRKMKRVFTGAIFVLFITQILLSLFHLNVWLVGVWLWLFFTAFTLLEASLPSLVAKIAPAGSKGTAMGVYSSSQFLGIFVGGALGGLIMHQWHFTGIFVFTAILSLLWFVIAITMKPPRHLSSLVLRLTQSDTAVAALRAIPGVVDAYISQEEGVAYLKVDKLRFKDDSVKHL
ncbi:MAG: MFS transporter, partial [Candidatus Ruthia sp.]|nr:MFS transporter [Candidatus Ruthturnera sp.]